MSNSLLLTFLQGERSRPWRSKVIVMLWQTWLRSMLHFNFSLKEPVSWPIPF